METAAQDHQPTGLVSVSFRQLDPSAIIDLCTQNNLKMIEWGGDVHVPPGDLLWARTIGKLTRSAHLRVAAYGSYYRLGESTPAHSFESILDTAVALGAPAIRVWAGNIGSENADESTWSNVCSDAERIAALASEAGVMVALEFHGGTLNDTPDAARKLWNKLRHPNLRSLWQPLPSLTPVEQDQSLSILLPHLSHLHVFHWLPGPPIERRPLREGFPDWSRWLALIRSSHPEIPALLEFVVADNPANLPADAATLHELLDSQVRN